MKKIVALALCLALALALCTVAFADTTVAVGDVYSVTSGKVTGNTAAFNGATFAAAAAPTYNTNGTVKDKGNVAYYEFNSDKYVVTTAAKASHAVYTANGWVYVVAGDIFYDYDAALVGGTYAKCVSVNNVKGTKTTDIKYYSFKDGDTVKYFTVDSTAADTALVDGEIVKFNKTNAVKDLVASHVWKVSAYEKDGLTAATYKCSVCGATAKVVTYAEYLAADEDVAVDLATGVYGILTSAGAAASTGVSSAKTFDAGVALYAGMALMSVAGSAVVIGKKKEF